MLDTEKKLLEESLSMYLDLTRHHKQDQDLYPDFLDLEASIMEIQKGLQDTEFKFIQDEKYQTICFDALSYKQNVLQAKVNKVNEDLGFAINLPQIQAKVAAILRLLAAVKLWI